MECAERHWRTAETCCAQSVYPTTSSACWLSALSGQDVATHGVPGVVFSNPAENVGLVNVFQYRGPGLTEVPENVFSDAARLGYKPISVLGDMETYDSAWRDALLSHAQPVSGHSFFTEDGVYRHRPPR